jgi:hypothetical protein
MQVVTGVVQRAEVCSRVSLRGVSCEPCFGFAMLLTGVVTWQSAVPSVDMCSVRWVAMLGRGIACQLLCQCALIAVSAGHPAVDCPERCDHHHHAL